MQTPQRDDRSASHQGYGVHVYTGDSQPGDMCAGGYLCIGVFPTKEAAEIVAQIIRNTGDCDPREVHVDDGK